MVNSFGTDGVRGVANVELTPEVAVGLGRAAVAVVGGRRWLVGADTRASGPMLVAALAAGLAAAGADVTDLGVVPTPTVAFHAQMAGAPAAVVSASHNPYGDNGIKLLAAGGRKLSDEVEARISATLARNVTAPPSGSPGVGGIDRHHDPLPPYVEHVRRSLEGRRLDGLRVVLDCANGAASGVAPGVLAGLGAAVSVLSAQPDGTNINAGCGSTHPDVLQRAVVAARADAGLAFDGDADRVLAVDHTGALVDGDQIIAVCATDRHRRGRLAGDAVVVTVMSNLGLRLALSADGIRVVETRVGDRYVLEALDAEGLSLGGEQSGHVVFRDLATTGDGLLTGLQLLDVVARTGRPLAEVAGAAMTRLPQVLRSVGVADRDALPGAAAVWDEVAAARAELGRRGRVVLRPSGTEPVVRVMVEAPSHAQATAVAARIAGVVHAALGGGPPAG